MFFRLFFLMNLFGFIITSTIRDHSSRNKKLTDYFSLSTKSTQNIFLNTQQMPMAWHDILFISILFFVFFLLLICLYYQRSLLDFICTLFTKTTNNNVVEDTNEHVTILHQTSPLKNVHSMYLTVPQPSYFHR